MTENIDTDNKCFSKRARLSIADKIKLIDKINNGATVTKLSKEFNVSRAAVRYIKRNKSTIIRFAESATVNIKQRKSMKTMDSVLDNVVYTWFNQAREQKIPISGPIICEKARLANIELGGDPNFKASSGWLDCFKKRHGIKYVSLQGQKLAADYETFQQEFSVFIQNNGYRIENIYNADETGLNWRNLPRKTLVKADERKCPGDKVNKERITILVCANASGSHRLPLVVIGKSKSPRSFRSHAMLPVIYMSQSSGWMSQTLFFDWYKNHFIACVKSRQESDGVTGKVLLLLDNAPSHLSAEILNTVDDQFSVKYLPAHTTSLIRPMDQGIIEKLKKMYRKTLLSQILHSKELENPMIYLEQFTLRDCCELIASAFNCLTSANLQAAWRKLLQYVIPIQIPDNTDDEIFLESMNIVRHIPDFSDNTQELRNWFNQDVNDNGWITQTIQEIVAQLVPNIRRTPEETNAHQKINRGGPSGDDALNAVNILIKWCTENPSCDNNNQNVELSCLRKVKTRIMSIVSTKTQIVS